MHEPFLIPHANPSPIRDLIQLIVRELLEELPIQILPPLTVLPVNIVKYVVMMCIKIKNLSNE